jgi:hypothetical protein
MENYSNTIANRTHDLPVCTAVPQPTAPPAVCPTRLSISLAYFIFLIIIMPNTKRANVSLSQLYTVCVYIYIYYIYIMIVGPVAQSVYRMATGWTVRGSNPDGARFSASVQTGPGAHPASCTMGTGSFEGVESGRGVTLTPHPFLVLRSKNRVELYLYSH